MYIPAAFAEPNLTKLHDFIEQNSFGLREIVQETVQVYEQAMPQPWSFDGSSTFVKRLLGQIVGFRIEIERIEGKWKLNQNHPVERRKKVIHALRERGDDNPQAVADMMEHHLRTTLGQREGGPT